MGRTALAVLLLLSGCVLAGGPRRPSCRIAATPAELVEGQPFEVEAAYDLPPAAGTATLHCEVKASDHTVLEAQTAEVRGKGTHRFRLTAPRRRMRQAVIALWLGEHWRRALSPIQFSPPIPVLTQEAQAMNDADRAAAPAILQRLGHERSEHGNVAILADERLGADPALAQALAEAIGEPEAGAPAVSFLGSQALANRYVVRREHFDLLVLTEARTVPARALRGVQRFLREGGSLVAIGTPAFGRVVRRVGDEWLDADQIRERLWQTQPQRVLFDFGRFARDRWARASNDLESESTFEAADGGKKGRCLHARISNLTGWDGLKSPPLDHPFPKGHTLTCFWAKGTARTTALAVEWVERDGSRWFATVPLTAEWRHFALPPSAFEFWHDSPTTDRGGPGDRLKPANARTLGFGLAFTHTPLPPGEHAFWVDQVGTAPDPQPKLTRLAAEEPEEPILDTLSPGYKFYPVTSARRFRVNPGQALVPEAGVPEPRTPLSSHVRPQATGCKKGRKWRWVPLIEARDRHGRRCGFPATLV
ncbi:MAG: hypothetical protein ACOC8D_02025, partial [bacterium]